jgi:hypothetical protein
MEPPPLEEFKRLMESLGSDSMFDGMSLFDESAAKAGMSMDDYAYTGNNEAAARFFSYFYLNIVDKLIL